MASAGTPGNTCQISLTEHLRKATLTQQFRDAFALVIADLEDEPAAGAEMVIAAPGELPVEPQSVLAAVERQFRFVPYLGRESAYPPR